MIGSTLRQLRKAHGLTLDDLAESSKVSRGTIHRIELDQVSPRMDTLASLCAAFGISVSEFFMTGHRPSEMDAPKATKPIEGLRNGVQTWLEHFEALIRYSADSLSVLDPHGFVVYETDCALHFHAGSPEERRARPWWNCAHPEEQTELQRTFEALLKKGEPTAHCQYRAAHRDGTWHWVNTTLSHQVDHPLIRGIIASTQDITLLKRMEEDSQRSQRFESLALALGGVSHAFSNLLMGIQGHLELAQDKQTSDSPSAIHLEKIQESMQRTSLLLDQMRDFAGNPFLSLESVDMNALLRSMAPGLQAMGQKGHELRLELGEGIPACGADRKLVERLLRDLAANSFDALGSDPGTVTFRTACLRPNGTEPVIGPWMERRPSETEESVILEVRDTGCGMEPAVLERVFDPFYSTKIMGRGMGLSAVQGIVRAHQGGLKVLSEPGQGTCIQVFFPSILPQTERSVPRPLQKTEGKAILVVDDNPQLRSCIRGMLEAIGHREILEAENGAQALNLYQAHAERVGLVVLDVDMPIMGGIEASRLLWGIDPFLKILFSTGAWDRDPLLSSKESRGITAILHKPYRLKELRGALARLL